MQKILDCYRSGQMSERQWQSHLADPNFRKWLADKFNPNVMTNDQTFAMVRPN